MTKKEIWVTLGIFIAVLAGVGASLFVLTKKDSQPTANTNSLQSSQSQTVPLKDTAGSQTGASDSLTVVAGTNTANPGQLGSGQTAAKQSDSSGTQEPPGPETFGQYEQYKSGQSGLFGDIVVGSGNEAVSGKKVAVYYKGWLTNGTLFDQSRLDEASKLQPFIFTLGAGQVIPGWEQTIAGMKVGGKRRVIIPPAVGYGATAQTGIPANSVLVFDVELLAIQ